MWSDTHTDSSTSTSTRKRERAARTPYASPLEGQAATWPQRLLLKRKTPCWESKSHFSLDTPWCLLNLVTIRSYYLFKIFFN